MGFTLYMCRHTRVHANIILLTLCKCNDLDACFNNMVRKLCIHFKSDYAALLYCCLIDVLRLTKITNPMASKAASNYDQKQG